MLFRSIGTGEHVGAGHALPDLEPFDAVRMAGRILGQGDVVALVERAAAAVDGEEAKRLERKARSKKGMDLEDFLVALRQMQQMGPLKQVLALVPGVPAKALQGLLKLSLHRPSARFGLQLRAGEAGAVVLYY